MTDHRHQATWVGPVPKSVAGKMALSCPICDIPNGDSGGHHVLSRVSIISSSKYITFLYQLYKQVGFICIYIFSLKRL